MSETPGEDTATDLHGETWWDRLTRAKPAPTPRESRPLFSRREYQWFLASVVFAVCLGVVIGFIRWQLTASPVGHAPLSSVPVVTSSMLTVIVGAPTLSPSITETWIRLAPQPSHTWVFVRPPARTSHVTVPVTRQPTYPRWTPPSPLPPPPVASARPSEVDPTPAPTVSSPAPVVTPSPSPGTDTGSRTPSS